MAIFITRETEQALLNLINKAKQLGFTQKHLVASDCCMVEQFGKVLKKNLKRR